MHKNKNNRRFRLALFGLGNERDYLFDDLSIMLKSGVSLGAGLEIIRKNAKQKNYRNIITQVITSIDDGSPLWKAFEKIKIFNEYSVSLIKAGEGSGRLAENLELVAKNEEKQRILLGKVKSAVSYPILVLFLTILVAIGAVTFIFPRLGTVFASLNVRLPVTTRVLVSIGKTMGSHGFIIIGGFLFILSILILLLFFFKPTKKYGDMLLLRTPVIHKLLKQVEIDRFGSFLGNLLEAGIPINVALVSLRQATRSYPYREVYDSMIKSVENGVSLEKSFRQIKHLNKLIPRPVQEMIVAGERSGRLPIVLQELGNRYEKKSDISADSLGQLIEPALLIFVGIGVFFIALSVIVPIYSLVGSLNNSQSTVQNTPVFPSTLGNNIEIFAANPGVVKVYSDATQTSSVIATVNTGEIFKYVDKVNGWYKIVLSNGQEGWVPVINTSIGISP